MTKRRYTPWQKITRAADRGSGVHLDCDEVRRLSKDDAIAFRAELDDAEAQERKDKLTSAQEYALEELEKRKKMWIGRGPHSLHVRTAEVLERMGLVRIHSAGELAERYVVLA